MCAGCDSKKQSFLRLFQEKLVIRFSTLNTGPFHQYFIFSRQIEDLLLMNNRKVVHSQGRQIIFNVYQFMKKEKEEGLTTPLSQLQQRVAEATGVGLCTVRRIIKEGESTPTSQPGSSKFSSPRKTVTQPRPKSTLDAFDEEIIRKVIYSFINTKKCTPTISKVLEEVKSAGVEFEGKKTTFWRVLRNLGFRWKKTEDNRKVLVEKMDIRAKRVEYLRRLKKYKEEGRYFVYSDETYLHSSHAVPKAWDDGKNRCVKAPVSKGQRLIIVHCGGKEGFIPNALLIFKSGQKSGDYHDDMNHTNYMKWMKEKVIPNLPKNCVFVVDNASYHNVGTEALPTSSWKKDEMQKWLSERGIFYEPSALKVELYEKIKQHKPQHKVYVLDKVLAENGHVVLRLPPYHPELNPIEKIWAIVKNRIAARNVTFKMQDVRKLADEEFEKITPENWKNVCEHVEQVESDYFNKEVVLDNVAELIININNDSDESDLWFSSGDEDVDCEPLQ